MPQEQRPFTFGHAPQDICEHVQSISVGANIQPHKYSHCSVVYRSKKDHTGVGVEKWVAVSSGGTQTLTKLPPKGGGGGRPEGQVKSTQQGSLGWGGVGVNTTMAS